MTTKCVHVMRLLYNSTQHSAHITYACKRVCVCVCCALCVCASTLTSVSSRVESNNFTLVRRNCRLPLYHVIIAFGRQPALSQATSYRRSATSGVGGLRICTVRGFTVMRMRCDARHAGKMWAKREKTERTNERTHCYYLFRKFSNNSRMKYVCVCV